jgi:high frequency lysogenization protein
LNRYEEQTVALAGVYQAAALVDQLARTGQADAATVEKSIYSIFQTHADTTPAVFSGLDGVRYGLRQLQRQLTAPAGVQAGISRYVIGVLLLAGKLFRDQQRLQRIGAGIHAAAAKLDLYDYSHGNQLAALAEIYSTTISSLSPRIMVKGEALHLQNPQTQNKIRALLLAGIRAAILWRQLGGSRLQLLFKRRQLLSAVRQLLQQTREETP